MSYFNTDIICKGCDFVERGHPCFEKARKKQIAELRLGNRCFKGIGAPNDLVLLSIQVRQAIDIKGVK